MANRIVSVHAGIYGMGIYAIMLPSSGFSVAHYFMYFLIFTHVSLACCSGKNYLDDHKRVIDTQVN